MIQGVLARIGGKTPELRYITDAGCHPQSYFKQVLLKMKHPLTGSRLKWSWGVDFYHACEYVSQLAASIFGKGTERANEWAEQQRHTLRHDINGVNRVIARAAQQRRRHGLRGSEKDYRTSLNYLKKYRRYMDYAQRKRRGEPIGSGITEAGCKVIFNQRLKQSGIRKHHKTGQHIVDLRTANRSGIWSRICRRLAAYKCELPPITQVNRLKTC